MRRAVGRDGHRAENVLPGLFPGDAQGSYLVKKLEGRHPIGARMPALYDPRPQSEIDVIRTWIDEGARNN